jgi:flagellar motility protein MotE (MotC chaperone)
MAADSPPIKAPDIPPTASKVSQSPFWTPIRGPFCLPIDKQAVAKAQAAFDKAEGEHAKRAAAIQAEMDALEKKARAEDADWDKERGRLKTALRRARD